MTGIPIPRKPPVGRYLGVAGGAAIVAMGYIEPEDPIEIPDASPVVIVSDLVVFPAGVDIANSRVGIIGNCDISQPAAQATVYAAASLICAFSQAANTNLRSLSNVIPVPANVDPQIKSLWSSYLSTIPDAAVAAGMGVSLQGAAAPDPDGVITALNAKLLWFVV